MPLPFCTILLVIGCILIWTKKKNKLGRWILTTSLIIILILSSTRISSLLIEPLENKYPAIPPLKENLIPPELSTCKYIVILGSGNSENTERSALSRLSSSGLARTTEALRIANLLPNILVIVSGPALGNFPTHATVVKDAAIELAFDENRIIKVESAKDTEEESLAIKSIVGDNKIILVTSAWHMHRAVYLFNKAGIKLVACPTDFTVRSNDPKNRFELNQINASLNRSTWAIHEYLGLIWLKLKEIL
jgi:uncharacterized SAM-binding protein YcdF (DUF218 family)